MPYQETDGCRIYYELQGDPQGRECVAFLNGVMASTASWESQAALFARFGFRLLLHDFRGQLRSDKPPGPYSFEAHASDLERLLEVTGIERVHLIGTSYGGEVGMVFAYTWPQRVRSLSLIDSVSELDPLLRKTVELWITLAERNSPEEFYWGVVPTLYGRRFLQRQPAFLGERAGLMAALPRDYFEGQASLYRTFLGLNITGKLSAIRCPTLVVCGEEDVLKPPAFSRLIAERIAGAELVVLPDCGHVAIYEKPEELASLLLGFVLKHGAGGRETRG
jgi:3-oxoadipate enol-lactonase